MHIPVFLSDHLSALCDVIRNSKDRWSESSLLRTTIANFLNERCSILRPPRHLIIRNVM